MCQISLTFEYSRMKVPSLSRGCEIAQFFVRYMAHNMLIARRCKCLTHNMMIADDSMPMCISNSHDDRTHI
jgi:hypothetical protein